MRIATPCATLAGALLLLPLGAAAQTRLSEVRIDQPSTDNDEYFEIQGLPTTSLTGLTYVVIGDGDGGSGVLEFAQSLDGQTIPLDGFFLGGGGDDLDNQVFGVTVDFQVDPIFENSDAVTHLLAMGFSGTVGDDLDTDDDGDLDVTPWTSVVDAIGFSDDTTPDFPYGEDLGFTDLPANGTFPFAHGFRDGATGEWRGGQFDPAVPEAQDTPGVMNEIVVANEPGPGEGALTLVIDANPVVGATAVRFTLPEAAAARLALYDVTGREVAVLAAGARAAGEATATLDAARLAPGVYVLRLTAGAASAARLVTVAR
jgi:hypothetical protein